METEAARFYGPVTGKTKKITVDATGGSTDLSTVTGFADLFDDNGQGKGKYIAFICDQSVQLAFGSTTVTIGADDPPFPSGAVQSFIAMGKCLGWKAAGSGSLYIWPAS